MNTATLDCGHPPAPQTDGSCGTGYGKDNQGRTHCYECCAAQDRAYLLGHDRFAGYLSSDGKSLTNWPGSVLGKVVVTGKRHPWSRHRYYVSVVDVHRQWWSGIGAPGEYCTLRRVKSPSASLGMSSC